MDWIDHSLPRLMVGNPLRITLGIAKQPVTKGFTMALNFDEHELDIDCPHCGNSVKEKLGRLKSDPELTCVACNKTFAIDATKFRTGISEAEKSLDSFLTNIGGMFK